MFDKCRLPLENIWHAKDDNTGDDVEEITKGQDTHKLMESILLAAEPEDEADIANNTKNTNCDLNIKFIDDNLNFTFSFLFFHHSFHFTHFGDIQEADFFISPNNFTQLEGICNTLSNYYYLFFSTASVLLPAYSLEYFGWLLSQK